MSNGDKKLFCGPKNLLFIAMFGDVSEPSTKQIGQVRYSLGLDPQSYG